MWPFAAIILEWPSRRGTNCHTNRSFRVVDIVNVHPHYILFSVIIINHLGSLEHIVVMQVMCLIDFLSC
eukprot:Gb_10679 [translate_table: standard]